MAAMSETEIQRFKEVTFASGSKLITIAKSDEFCF